MDSQGNLRLFGEFGIADCFFAPVILRFVTYQPELSMLARSYLNSMRQHPSFQVWVEAALQEDEILGVDEAGVDRK